LIAFLFPLKEHDFRMISEGIHGNFGSPTIEFPEWTQGFLSTSKRFFRQVAVSNQAHHHESASCQFRVSKDWCFLGDIP